MQNEKSSLKDCRSVCRSVSDKTPVTTLSLKTDRQRQKASSLKRLPALNSNAATLKEKTSKEKVAKFREQLVHQLVEDFNDKSNEVYFEIVVENLSFEQINRNFRLTMLPHVKNRSAYFASLCNPSLRKKGVYGSSVS